MNIFQTMLSRFTTRAVNADHLPVVNDFVDVAIGGKTFTVCFENIDGGTFETQSPGAAGVGASALFNYRNRIGRFRFRTQCISISTDETQATFALPTEITVIDKYNEKRQKFRLKLLMSVHWRYAPNGIGYGPYLRSNTTDISTHGASLYVGRELRQGTLVEIVFDQILVDGEPLAALGELTRPAAKAENAFLAGIQFTSLGLTAQNSVIEFIQERESIDKQHHLVR